MSKASPGNRPFVVLQSAPEPGPMTNPYIVMLGESLDRIDGVSVRWFSWRAALLSRYDVFHVHWPEALVEGRTPLRKFTRHALYSALLLRLTLSRIPIVRTVHNLALPTGITRRETILIKLTDRLTKLRIRVNDTTPIPESLPSTLIRHGHYRDWFARQPRRDVVPGRIAFFGLIRRYKAVHLLMEAFTELPRIEDYSLRVAGKPSTEELRAELQTIADADDRIDVDFAFQSDEALVARVSEAELIVLPYPEMHNSAAVLTSLSLGRPVLVSNNEVNRRLGEEVGHRWVNLYDQPLTAVAMEAALKALRQDPEAPGPDLSLREWDEAGTAHLAAYRRARRGD